MAVQRAPLSQIEQIEDPPSFATHAITDTMQRDRSAHDHDATQERQSIDFPEPANALLRLQSRRAHLGLSRPAE